MALNYTTIQDAATKIGEIDLKLLLPEPALIAEYVRHFVASGSRKNAVAKEDLTIVARPGFAGNQFANLMEALSHGTKFFDAVYYFCLREADRPDINVQDVAVAPAFATNQDLSLAIFCLYFWLLTRANIPRFENGRQTQPTPNFLTNVLGADINQATWLSGLASFDLIKVDHRWIRHINTDPLGVEARNRFGLGVAGYRVIDAVLTLAPDNNPDQSAQNAIDALRSLRNKGPLWDVHPVTRSTEFLTVVKSLNKNLDNLLLDSFSQATLTELVRAKKLFRMPIRDPGYNQYKQWIPATFDDFNDRIFH